MLVKLAWKNIGRNKLRSGVILTAITLGLFCGTFLSAFLNGWMISTVNADINLQLSHIQIHHPSYEDNNDINAWFKREEAEKKSPDFRSKANPVSG